MRASQVWRLAPLSRLVRLQQLDSTQRLLAAAQALQQGRIAADQAEDRLVVLQRFQRERVTRAGALDLAAYQWYLDAHLQASQLRHRAEGTLRSAEAAHQSAQHEYRRIKVQTSVLDRHRFQYLRALDKQRARIEGQAQDDRWSALHKLPQG